MPSKKSRSKIQPQREIRRARKSDAGKIQAMLAKYAEKKLLLPRSKEEIEEHIGAFVVARLGTKTVGCCASRDFGRGLQEIRSLAVVPSQNGRGIGSALVKKCVSGMKRQGAKKIFALTYRPNIFTRMGFKIVHKELFPEKIWADCSKCPKKDKCDEIAVMMEV